jgi:hypothetical protein
MNDDMKTANAAKPYGALGSGNKFGGKNIGEVRVLFDNKVPTAPARMLSSKVVSNKEGVASTGLAAGETTATEAMILQPWINPSV